MALKNIVVEIVNVKKVFINQFTLFGNVYVKDITANINVINHWKYKIDGIEYYVPNHGFLTLIDSDYGGLYNPPKTLMAEMYSVQS